MRSIAVTLISLAVATLATAQAGAAEYNPAQNRPGAEAEPAVERFIVKLRSSSQARLQVQGSQTGESASTNTTTTTTTTTAAASDRVRALAGRVQATLNSARGIGPNLQAMHVTPVVRGERMEAMLARLKADSDVEYAVPDRRVYAHSTTSNDPLAAGQWYLQATEASAINAIGAWDITTGSNNIVIADIDTGVRADHPDLVGRLLPGYDFVSADPNGTFFTANDGDGRDADSSDPGDWITSVETTAHSSCGSSAANSSWHGTRVLGIIGAATNNGVGVAGVTWSSKLLPVRALGKCGGYNSDVLAGMNWAAGVDVQGVPHNANPAQILNISLGGEGSCDSASADVVSTLASNGVLIVVSAGNEGGPVDSPANCPGAMGVAGLRHAGTKVGFSSLGPEIALGAPGGNCVNTNNGPCLFSIDTTSNAGTTVPGANIYTSQLIINVGTSFSAPIVSGIAGLMLAVNGNLKSTQLIARLKEGATKPFPISTDTTIPTCHVPTSATDLQAVECNCTTSTCGAGMANALGSVNAALRPIAVISPPGSAVAGSTLALNGGASTAANGHQISSYTWTVGGDTISSGSTATVMVPTTGSTKACLIVVDDTGKKDTAKIVVSPTSSVISLVPNDGTIACLPQVTVAASDASASEAAGSPGAFTFTRTGDASSPLSATIGMSGTAVNGTNYQTIGTTVTFAAGASTAVVTVTPIDDTVVNASRTAVATIQAGTGYDIGTASSATVTIADNDTSMSSSSAGSSGGGGGGSMDWLTLAVTLGAAVALARGQPLRQVQPFPLRPPVMRRRDARLLQ